MTRARILADYVNAGDELALKAPLASPTFTGTNTVSGDLVPATPLSHRNMIINGAMQVWQRATAATAASQSYHTVDRWKMLESTDGAYTSEKHTMSLAELNTTGHSTALKLVPTTADTDIEASQYAYISQSIEAQNCQHLQYGTANAKTLTLSFWVKSNITGIWTINITKRDTTNAVYVSEYTINVANAWEQKTITISPTAGSTSYITGAGGVIANDNGQGLELAFNLGYGSNWNSATSNTWNNGTNWSTTNHSTTASFMANTNNTFYLTGVQLELGSSATPFEHRSFADELRLCERYYQKVGGNLYMGHTSANTYYSSNVNFKTEMLGTPTADYGGFSGPQAGVIVLEEITPRGCRFTSLAASSSVSAYGGVCTFAKEL